MHRSTLLASGFALAVLASAPFAATQDHLAPVVRPAPAWMLDAIQVTDGNIQDLKLPWNRETFQFRIVLGDEIVTIELEANDVRSPGFKLLVQDATGIHQVPTPVSVTWRGRVLGHPEGAVGASIVNEVGRSTRVAMSVGCRTDRFASGW